MWPDRDECVYCTCDVKYRTSRTPTPEEHEANLQRIALITDLIELGKGKNIQELHPEMSPEEQCNHMLTLLALHNQL